MQKKIMTGVAFSLVLLLGGCGAKNTTPLASQESVTHTKNAIYTPIKENKKLKQKVLQAAKEKGWRVTPLNESTLIAEKFDSQPPKATTIKIGNGVVDFDNMDGTDDSDIVDLKEYIQDLTQEEQSEH